MGTKKKKNFTIQLSSWILIFKLWLLFFCPFQINFLLNIYLSKDLTSKNNQKSANQDLRRFDFSDNTAYDSKFVWKILNLDVNDWYIEGNLIINDLNQQTSINDWSNQMTNQLYQLIQISFFDSFNSLLLFIIFNIFAF